MQTCTVRDLLPEGASAAPEPDPAVARLKSSVAMVRAIEPAVRLYEEAPTTGMEVETEWADLWLSPHDWAEAFDSPAPGTPHNEARDQVWEQLVEILLDKIDDDVPSDLLRRSLARNPDLVDAFTRAWPLIDAADLVGDLWSVPAYLRLCAPWLDPDEVRAAAARRPPGLDGVRPPAAGRRAATSRRPRDVAAPSARRRGAGRPAPGDGERRRPPGRDRRLGPAGDVDAARCRTSRSPSSTSPCLSSVDPDLLAGPFAHLVVDEAQELTDAEWQMLLVRCPVAQPHRRRRPGPGPARLHGVVGGTAGQDRSRTRRPRCAEHQLPDAGGGDGRGGAGHPGGAAGLQRAHVDPQQRCAGRARCHLRPARVSSTPGSTPTPTAPPA